MNPLSATCPDIGMWRAWLDQEDRSPFLASHLAECPGCQRLVAFTPGGQAAAAGFLAQFRSQSVAAVEISPQSQTDIMRTMNALGNLGSVQMPGATGTRPETAARGLAEQVKTVFVAEAATAV